MRHSVSKSPICGERFDVSLFEKLWNSPDDDPTRANGEGNFHVFDIVSLGLANSPMSKYDLHEERREAENLKKRSRKKNRFFELFLLRHVMTHYRSCLKFAIVKRPDIVRGWPSSPHGGTVMTGALELQQ